MADDNGIIADMEAALAASLAAITLSSAVVFRTADVFRYQLLGGPDTFSRFAPFALVEYESDRRSSWEGDHDLNQRLLFSIYVGVESPKKVDGARIGTGTDAALRQLGISRLRDLIITDLQNKRLTTTNNKNEHMEYEGSTTIWKEPKRHIIQMRFSVDYVDSYPPQ